MKKKRLPPKRGIPRKKANGNLKRRGGCVLAPANALVRRQKASGNIKRRKGSVPKLVNALVRHQKANRNIKPRKGCVLGPVNARVRRQEAYLVRQRAAKFQQTLPLMRHPCNGDEKYFINKIANYSKGLPHNSLGEVNLKAYHAWIHSLKTANPDDFESIPLGGVVKLSNPQAAYAFDLAGPDSHHIGIAAPPSFSSNREAGEMAELYWQALTRDVPFLEYDNNQLIRQAAADLSTFSIFAGPKVKGVVTPGTLFRGITPGDLVGPYISQFLAKDIPFGATTIIQQYRTTVAGVDHMTSYHEWLNIQNGLAPTTKNVFDPIPRYIRSNRDLGEYVHRDFNYQSILCACLILFSFGDAALDPANPYLRSRTQAGFITFGAPHILDLVAKAARVALEAAWFQKFLVHRRLRPEEFGGRVHNVLTRAANYPINTELLHSQAILNVYSKYHTYLLPQAYPEGCPTHPAYPAGHACMVGAGVTMLKAFFNESYMIQSPVVASSDGRSLLPYTESSLTIGGELNKLASNIALGRDAAGVHWRSDGYIGLKIGEAVAIGIIRDYRATYNEKFFGFSLTKFDGTTIRI
ncbi:vanadium-dependent haloperoxidase [Aneurinibacillus sp. Ricciae_BoGa-3]|uniref:vanadium-dependent haloperoxidase n=1 Tax=Aneurinibacillus sp. Ricciae_BoGa-3 TaxID=3022697 RepID=UPI00234131ED|nr:vanadium-dependent haloperoxidase [Aneurinibacillus sp. Ricciae_BoGa-3]WCK56188.1 vanadium-dependent haloperoxidase [Aneurinibacillus sp. Ricciae_BoGa-3]